MNQPRLERLDKFLSHAGLASRKDIKKLLKANNITVNGKRATSVGVRIDPSTDEIKINDQLITKKDFVYYILNKPIGVVSTTDDPQGRTHVLDLMDVYEKIYPVGRLDRDTHGLMLLTNNGELTHKLIHPKYHIPKVYRLTVAETPTEEQLHLFRTGVLLRDGITLPAEVEVVKNPKNEIRSTKQIQNTNDQISKRFEHLNLEHLKIVSGFDIRYSNLTTLEVTLHEGRNRQIRRMCKALSIELLDLQRISFGPLELGDLKIGEWRELTENEVKKLTSFSTIDR